MSHATVASRLAALLGRPRVLTGVDCSPYVVEGRTPAAVALPGSREEVAAVLALAAEAGLPVIPWGGGTHMTLGAPPPAGALVLALGRLDRVLEHEPGDLTATVEAGATVAAFQERLGRHGQWLSLDPPRPERASVGGVLAVNAAGPRRHLYGTARDLLIGCTVVLAEGVAVRGGGKVVKNVAGYDLPKLVVGSFGTLGVIVEATFKLRPRPEVDRLAILRFDSLARAGDAARAVLASELLPAALDLVHGPVLAAAGIQGAEAALLAALDGLEAQVEWQRRELERLGAERGAVGAEARDGAARDAAWRALAEVDATAFARPAAVMRWSVLPAQVADVIAEAASIAGAGGLEAAFVAHAGTGLVRGVLGGGEGLPDVAGTLGRWRALARARGGQALLESAPLALKERVPVWDAPGPALRVMQRIKAELDPRGVLNPGRFVGGI
jgi:glycolate oxidase FAD binding subunit